MNLEIALFSEIKQPTPLALIKKILKKTSNFFKKPKTACLSVILVGEKKMKNLNWLYRQKNQVTNVLSFPTFLKKDKIRSRDLEIEEDDLGDIFICYPEALRETKKYQLTLKEELSRLLVHGFLHLLGYDHQKEKEAIKMERLEKRILKSLRENKL
jgi:probable rRNA maturation factor